MSKRDVRGGSLLRTYIDGVPLDLGSALLPRKTWASAGALLHIHLHARAQRKYEHTAVESAAKGRTISKQALLGLVGSLRGMIEGLEWTPAGTQWAEYT